MQENQYLLTFTYRRRMKRANDKQRNVSAEQILFNIVKTLITRDLIIGPGTEKSDFADPYPRCNIFFVNTAASILPCFSAK